MAVRITDTAIAKAARESAESETRQELIDAQCPGLRLRVTPGGTKTWALNGRDQSGRMRRFSLGAYPAMGIAEAREAARALVQKVRHQGADPTAEKRRKRAEAEAAKAGVGTLASVLDAYGAKAGKELKSWPDSRKRVEVVLKPLLSHAAAALTVGDLQLAIDRYPSQMSAAFAVRTIRPALRWAAAPGRGYVPAELAGVRPPVGSTRRKRVLTREELAAILPVLRASSRPYAAAMRFMLLTLTRRQEAALARWGHVDLAAGTWTIPETKNGEPHTVPLSRQAIDLLRTIRPADAKRTDLVFRTNTGAPLLNWDRETKTIQAASGTADWHRHDLRRTGATMLGEMGELPDIIEAALNHVAIRSALAATYNRARYRPQVAAALQRLADALDGIEAGAAAVVPLRRVAAE
jgi:integrase